MKILGLLSSVLLLPHSNEVIAVPANQHGKIQARQAKDKMVFCHYMVGAGKSLSSASSYDNDMKLAKQVGIDAFALNIGPDSWTETQLGYAYESAAKNGMSVFISFDFNRFQTTQALDVANILGNFINLPAQLKVDGKPFVSTFSGSGLDLPGIRNFVKQNRGVDLFVVPNFKANNLAGADGLFNWNAWPSDGNNKAPTATSTYSVRAGDQQYQTALGSLPYMAPVSPWFSTHYSQLVTYSKNWVFPCDLLWFSRWYDMLSLTAQYAEILTWNDFGESHYIGPLNSPHTDDGNSQWTNDMPHEGWSDMARPFIAAFKAGATKPDEFITEEKLIYWYRPSPKNVQCDATDTCKPWTGSTPNSDYTAGRPMGADTVADAVFVVALLTKPGKVTITSGSNSQTFDAPAGASSWSLAMGTGKQSFALDRNGQNILRGTSLKDIGNDCPCGIYNWNAYVGTLPSTTPATLQPEGLEKFTLSMAGPCKPTPSL